MEETDQLIVDNQKLVYWIFNKNIAKTELTNFFREDLISEGFIGLVKAARTFDSSKGTKFVTLASICILNQMRMAIRNYKRDFDKTQSLEAPLNYDQDGNSLTLEDVLEGRSTIDEFMVEEELNLQREVYDEAIVNLKDRQIEVLRLREQGLKQREIASEIGVSQSYVNRIIGSGIKELKVKVKEIEMKPRDPNSPKRINYRDEDVFRKDYQKYQYLKRQGREDEFKKTPELTDLNEIKPISQHEVEKVKTVIPVLDEIAAPPLSVKCPEVAFNLVIQSLDEKEKKLLAEIEAIRKTKKLLTKILLI